MEMWNNADWIQVLLALVLVGLCALMVLLLAWFSYFTRKRHVFGPSSRCCVVGAAKGIGRAVAVNLAKRGVSQLFLVDIANAEQTQKLCKEAGCERVTCIRCDVTDVSQVEAVSKAIGTEALDLLVDCAGVVTGKPLEDLTIEEFKRVVDVNLIGAFALVKMLVPPMLKRNKGCVVNVSSLMGLMGGARLSDYCASKFGLVGLFEALRMEYGYSHNGISFVTVCPYAVDTGMFNGIFEATALTRLIKTVFPILKSEAVADQIVIAAERGTTVAVVPFMFSPLINIARCLPSPLYEAVLTLMGGRDGMNRFKGTSNIWGKDVSE